MHVALSMAPMNSEKGGENFKCSEGLINLLNVGSPHAEQPQAGLAVSLPLADQHQRDGQPREAAQAVDEEDRQSEPLFLFPRWKSCLAPAQWTGCQPHPRLAEPVSKRTRRPQRHLHHASSRGSLGRLSTTSTSPTSTSPRTISATTSQSSCRTLWLRTRSSGKWTSPTTR